MHWDIKGRGRGHKREGSGRWIHRSSVRPLSPWKPLLPKVPDKSIGRQGKDTGRGGGGGKKEKGFLGRSPVTENSP